MANYVFNNQKKRFRLVRLEQDLQRSIHNKDSHERQLHLAEEIRLARIRALRAEQSNLKPTTESCSDRFAAIDKQIASLNEITPDKILAEFIAA